MSVPNRAKHPFSFDLTRFFSGNAGIFVTNQAGNRPGFGNGCGRNDDNLASRSDQNETLSNQLAAATQRHSLPRLWNDLLFPAGSVAFQRFTGGRFVPNAEV